MVSCVDSWIAEIRNENSKKFFVLVTGHQETNQNALPPNVENENFESCDSNFESCDSNFEAKPSSNKNKVDNCRHVAIPTDVNNVTDLGAEFYYQNKILCELLQSIYYVI